MQPLHTTATESSQVTNPPAFRSTASSRDEEVRTKVNGDVNGQLTKAALPSITKQYAYFPCQTSQNSFAQ